MAAVWLFLKAVPWYAYVIVILALGWLESRHTNVELKRDIVVIQATDANAKIKALQDAAAISNARIAALQGEVDASKKRADASSASASAAGAAVVSLSGVLAATKRRLAAASHSAAASDVAATNQTAQLCTGLLDVCEARSAERSRFADSAFDASVGCAAQYDSLRPPSTAAGPGIRH